MTRANSLHLGLTGWPLGHSLSPAIHQAGLDAQGRSGEYRLYPVPALPHGQEALEKLLQRMRSGELDGLNVTIPYKQTILPLLDDLTPAARSARAANTIFREGNLLVGDNTDIAGFKADLAQFISDQEVTGRHALLLGAGGAASAAAVVLIEGGWQLTIAARNLEQAQTLIRNVGQTRARTPGVVRMERGCLERHLSASPTGLIVNATPLGMSPQIEAMPWPEGLNLPNEAAVYDLIYNPRETRLVRTARAVGLPASGGIGMLVEQAALAFERWTGQAAPRNAMRAAVEIREYHE